MKILAKYATLTLLAALCPLPASLLAEGGSSPGVDLETLKSIAGLPLPPETIQAFQTSAETRSGSKLTYNSSVYKISMPKSQKDQEKLKEKYNKKGVAPLRICIDIDELKKNAKKPTGYLKGDGMVIVVDQKTKKIVEKKSLGLSKLCPS